MSHKITLLVCRSCIRENAQTDPCFQDNDALEKTYAEKLKKGFFGHHAELRLTDCLTNCQNSNAVEICRADGQILLGLIRSEKDVDQVIDLVKTLKDSSAPLQVSDELQEKMVCVRSAAAWRAGTEAAPADRVKLTPR